MPGRGSPAGRTGEARPGGPDGQVEALAMWPLARGTGVRGEGRVWKTRVNSLWKIDLLDSYSYGFTFIKLLK